jgi:hypothetical protein
MKLPALKVSFSYGPHIRVMRDWFVILGMLTLLLAGSVFYNVWLFSQVTSGHSLSGTTTIQAVSDAPLSEVSAIYSARALERAQYLSTAQFIDPSRVSR